MSGGDVLELTLDLGELDADAVESACFAAGALAVIYTDTRDDPILEPAPGEFRLWPKPRLQATFAANIDPAVLARVIGSALQIAANRLQFKVLADRAWEREWLKDFRPMRFGQRLWVCPTHERVAQDDAAVVSLDPGLAFGTGTHPTTGLCLEWLDSHPPQDSVVIDFGCGSGILALAALRLGARRAWCHDIDPQALSATLQNACTNALQERLQIAQDVRQLPTQVDLLLANILSGPLCQLAAEFAARVRAGGHVVLAGLLAEQAAEVNGAYVPWFAMEVSGARDGWVCLSGTRLPH